MPRPGTDAAETFSRLYALLADRSSDPSGDVWEHGRLQLLVRDALALVTAYGDARADDAHRAAVAAASEAVNRGGVEVVRTLAALRERREHQS